ncbi:hypothetical protein BDW02DRAFT_643257 [Decorospora gaudefroyi]|uniref:AB hydrolase-1 domain-containing protein n=1 Tax=Decorospora gaudefroyi TaxID=184978 RepID=A0A6A5JW75_9PLEO|nr:hypothetical protein BDW02DRAFT_643257 [Decorospora gaudefroyi]
MGALEFICDRRFHRSFVLPANPQTERRKPYRVSYADFGDVNSNAVVLFCGALFGSRLYCAPLDQLAKAHKVRIIHPDRPGVGGSDTVELEKRIQIWLEMVPQLLSHLNISHVAIASHSGGDIYLVNTILTYPHLLNPEHPYVCFFAPWVHPTHSRMLHLLATELLPASLIGKFGPFGRFINQNVIPMIGLSGLVATNIKTSLLESGLSSAPVALDPSAISRSRACPNSSPASFQDIGLDDPQVVDELRTHIAQFLFAECVDGVSADAQLFLKRAVSWRSPSIDWTDFDDVVQLLSRIISEDNRLTGSNRTWAFDCFHAEHDQMVGEKGKKWFNDVWVSSPSYEYHSQDVEGTEHNLLMDPKFGASETWLRRVSESWQTPSV